MVLRRAPSLVWPNSVLMAGEFVGNDRGHARGRGQDVEQVGDLGHHVLVLADDLVLLEAGQALQAHLQDFAGLVIRQAVEAVGLDAELASASLRGGRPRGRPALSPATRASISRTIDESQLLLISAAFATGGVGEALMVSMNSSMLASATARPSSTWPRSRALRSSNTVRRVTTSRRCSRKTSIRSFRLHSLRLAVDQRHHVHAEGVLQLRLLVQVVQHHLGHFAALQLDHDAHARLVGLVLDVADAFELLLVHQLGHALLQRLLVHLVRAARRR